MKDADQQIIALLNQIKALSGGGGGDFIPTSALDTDGTLAANSDAKVASQKSTKTYADTKQTAAQVQALIDMAVASLPVTSSGVYAPVASDLSNLDSVAISDAQYLRIGNTVTVSGRYTVTATVPGTAIEFRMTLPVASTFAEVWQAGGVALSQTSGNGAGITGRVGDPLAVIASSTSVALPDAMAFVFSYQIIP